MLVRGSGSLSGHSAAEKFLQVGTEQNFIWAFISISQSHTGFITMVHLAYKVSHQCRWKLRDSSWSLCVAGRVVGLSQSGSFYWITLCRRNTQIYEGRLTVSNRQLSWWSHSIWTESSLQRRIGLQNSKWIHHPMLRHFGKPFRTASQHPSFSVEHLMKQRVYIYCSGFWEQAKQPLPGSYCRRHWSSFFLWCQVYLACFVFTGRR